MPLILLTVFVGLPILEIYIIIQVGQQIGALPTLLLLVVESLLGGWLVKREGRRAWEALRAAVTTGHLPARELSDAALVLVGGTLLLTPGFVSDVLGFFFVLPFTRPLARRLLGGIIARRASAGIARGRGYSPRRGDVHQIHRPGDEPPSGP